MKGTFAAVEKGKNDAPYPILEKLILNIRYGEKDDDQSVLRGDTTGKSRVSISSLG